MTQENIVLKTFGRENSGKGPARRVRMEGKVPGVVYGPKMDKPFNVCFEPNDIIRAYKSGGKTSLMTLDLAEGAPAELKGTKVLLKEVTTHPYKTKLIHVDLFAMDLSKKMRVTVPVNYVGKAKGVLEGGALNVSVREVEVRCAPDKIPAHLDADISDIDINESYHLSTLEKLYPDLEFIYEKDLSLLGVSETREEKTAAETAQEAAAAAGTAAPAAEGAAAAAPEGDKK